MRNVSKLYGTGLDAMAWRPATTCCCFRKTCLGLLRIREAVAAGKLNQEDLVFRVKKILQRQALGGPGLALQRLCVLATASTRLIFEDAGPKTNTGNAITVVKNDDNLLPLAARYATHCGHHHRRRPRTRHHLQQVQPGSVYAVPNHYMTTAFTRIAAAWVGYNVVVVEPARHEQHAQPQLRPGRPGRVRFSSCKLHPS
jgi:hypothetical protein